METNETPPPRGRGAGFNPPNRFERLHAVEQALADGDEKVSTRVFRDDTESILAHNDSPDVGFDYGINPYRGCEHGCVYCYARPTHEYLGFSAGVDFESKILVKEKAPELLAKAFEQPGWDPQTVALSGNTDPYQPIEQEMELTRQCLEVFLRYRNPVSIITKNHGVTRDRDLLTALAENDLVKVTLSITSLRREITRVMEPRTSRPGRRLDAVGSLAEDGVPVGVNVAPVIPGLTDEELPAILEAAHDRGARHAGYILVRLPHSVKQLFVDWVKREFPDRASKILGQIRSTRGGELSDSEFGSRMKGEGELADLIEQMFDLTCDRLGLNDEAVELSTDQFRREPSQTRLF